MELKKIMAKYKLTVKSVISNLDFKDLTKEKNVDIFLDEYISNTQNMQKIQEDIENSIQSNWNIDEFIFNNEDVEINMAGNNEYEIKNDLIVFVDTCMSIKMCDDYIEDALDRVFFKSDKKGISVHDDGLIEYDVL